MKMYTLMMLAAIVAATLLLTLPTYFAKRDIARCGALGGVMLSGQCLKKELFIDMQEPR